MLETIEDPNRDHPGDGEILMGQAVVASRRSECMQRKVGAVVARTGGRIVGVGRNDVPNPLQSCRHKYGKCYRQIIRDKHLQDLANRFKCRSCGELLDSELRCKGCSENHAAAFDLFRNLDICRAVHAEENALLHLTPSDRKDGAALHLYTTTHPCSLCAPRIVGYGVDTVFFIDPYPSQESYDVFSRSDVRVEHFEGFTLRGIEKTWGEA